MIKDKLNDYFKKTLQNEYHSPEIKEAVCNLWNVINNNELAPEEKVNSFFKNLDLILEEGNQLKFKNVRQKGSYKNFENATQFALTLVPHFKEAKNKGLTSYGKKASFFNSLGLRTRENKKFNRTIVQRNEERILRAGVEI